MIVTEALTGRQTPLETVQTKMFGPGSRPATFVRVLPGAESVAPPEVTVQKPVPVVGVTALRLALELQRVCEGTVLAGPGTSSR